MKALTIKQPYPWLILASDRQLAKVNAQRKRVENRSWNTKYRGPLAIHAGVSLSVLNAHHRTAKSREDFPELVFGAIVGVVDLVDCVKLDAEDAYSHYPWLASHQHATGPYCWILDKPRRLEIPIYARGRQGLWPTNIDPGILDDLVA